MARKKKDWDVTDCALGAVLYALFLWIIKAIVGIGLIVIAVYKIFKVHFIPNIYHPIKDDFFSPTWHIWKDSPFFFPITIIKRLQEYEEIDELFRETANLHLKRLDLELEQLRTPPNYNLSPEESRKAYKRIKSRLDKKIKKIEKEWK